MMGTRTVFPASNLCENYESRPSPFVMGEDGGVDGAMIGKTLHILWARCLGGGDVSGLLLASITGLSVDGIPEIWAHDNARIPSS